MLTPGYSLSDDREGEEVNPCLLLRHLRKKGTWTVALCIFLMRNNDIVS